MNGAQSLIQTLVNGGLDVCFTNPGTSEMHFVAALDKVAGMRAVLGLFEGVCTGAADGYARMTGKPGLTLLHLGPGLGNGLANLHNARRASSPIINIVGEHATYHRQYDAPLTADIEGIAHTMSAWVHTIATANDVPSDTAKAITAAQTYPGQIASLILPADCAWNESCEPATAVSPPLPPTINETAVDHIAHILRKKEPTLMLISGDTLQEKGLRFASRIAQATGAKLMANRPASRMQRGTGRPIIGRLPYPVPLATRELSAFKHIILVNTKPPVAFFAYPNSPSLLSAEDSELHTLATPNEDGVAALAAVAEALNIPEALGAVYDGERPSPPTGELTVAKVWQTVGAYMPEQAIICDEAITSSRGADELTAGAPPHDWLFLTGGSIGIGLPLATGASVACPDRRVISMQADGSAMYTVQALWTQAREQLDIVTVLFNNRSYKILQGELQRVGADTTAVKAQSLMNLDNPNIDWVQIAQGMGVEATRAETAAALNQQFQAALNKSGPHLIEVLV